MSEVKWYFSRSGSKEGPVNKNDLVNLIVSGQIKSGTKLWNASLPGWTPIEKTEFANLVSPAVAVPPLPGNGPATMSPMPNIQNQAQTSPAGVTDSHTRVTQSLVESKRGMSLIESVKMCFSKYFCFKGRASRSEYWWFNLFLLLCFFPGAFLVFPIFIMYGGLIPLLSCAVRRLHDSGHSGWLLLVPFYNLYLVIIDGQHTDNKYGPALK